MSALKSIRFPNDSVKMKLKARQKPKSKSKSIKNNEWSAQTALMPGKHYILFRLEA